MTNIIGWIQRGIKLELLYGNQHVVEVYNYLRTVGFKSTKEYTNDDFMKAMQSIVRKKYKGYKTIQSMTDFIPNPNPNSKRRK